MHWITNWRGKPDRSFRPLGVARPIIAEPAAWHCTAPDDIEIPEQVAYLAGDIAAAMGRIRVLQAHGIDVICGLNGAIRGDAEIVIDAASFDAAWKYQRQIDSLAQDGGRHSVLILHPDRILVCPVGRPRGRFGVTQGLARTPAQAWLMSHFRTRARTRIGQAQVMMPAAS